ncbi:MAG: Uma2 family endonuclease [Polyangiaceae bacterium]
MEAIERERVRPLRRREFEQLAEQGAFDNERVELVYGTLVTMPPPGPPHSGIIQKLNKLLVFGVGDRAELRCQLPWVAGDYSMPQPDFAIVPRGSYMREHPSEALLVIEVSDSSLAYDRGVKRQLYAEFGVPECWIVNVPERRIEVFTSPTDGAYRDSRSYGPGDCITLGAFSDLTIAVDDVLRE